MYVAFPRSRLQYQQFPALYRLAGQDCRQRTATARPMAAYHLRLFAAWRLVVISTMPSSLAACTRDGLRQRVLSQLCLLIVA